MSEHLVKAKPDVEDSDAEVPGPATDRRSIKPSLDKPD